MLFHPGIAPFAWELVDHARLRFQGDGCNVKYVGETGKTLKTKMKQHSLDTGHQFVFDEAQIIGQAQTKACRLFMEAIYFDENSINSHITLDPYAMLL